MVSIDTFIVAVFRYFAYQQNKSSIFNYIIYCYFTDKQSSRTSSCGHYHHQQQEISDKTEEGESALVKGMNE